MPSRIRPSGGVRTGRKTTIAGSIRSLKGWVKDPKDDRDHWAVGLTSRCPGTNNEISLVPHSFEPYDQLRTSSCVGQAVAAAIYLAFYAADEPSTRRSALMAYFCARRQHTKRVVDSGTYIRGAIKAANRFGCCADNLWPFNSRKVNTQPDWNALQDGSHVRGRLRYERIEDGNINLIRSEILSGRPVVCGFDKLFGGPHCVCLVGTKIGGGVICLNSWGKGWGNNGRKVLTIEEVREARSIWSVSMRY